MRNRVLYFSLVILLVGSMFGCGGASTTTSVPAEEGKLKSMEAAKPVNSAENAPPNSQGAMPSYYGKDYPGASGQGYPGAPGGGQPGGTQPGR